jgi:hypothetical protein
MIPEAKPSGASGELSAEAAARACREYAVRVLREEATQERSRYVENPQCTNRVRAERETVAEAMEYLADRIRKGEV